jgi:hypothetical protein
MYFDLTNSPATFQTMMNEIFQDLTVFALKPLNQIFVELKG